MIAELKEENEVLKETVVEQQMHLASPQDGFKEEVVQEQIDTLGEEKKQLERELRAVENRIKHILTENEEIEAEKASYDKKALKILEARAKKLEWEKKKQRELELAEEAERKKRESLVIKAVERDQVISQRRGHFSKIQDKAMEEQKEQMRMSKALKSKIEEYERVLRDHKKLQSLSTLPPSKVDQLHRVKNEHKDKKEKLTSKVKLESAAVSELDKKLEKLRELEQKMLEEKKASLTQKGQIKSHLEDIMNKKLEEKEIYELLAAREKPTKSPTGIRRKSIEKLLKGENIPTAIRAKSPGLPTKFIGGNIGSFTEMRNQTYAQRERTSHTAENGSVNQSVNMQKQQKYLQGTRFASPQARLTQPRPTTAASKVTSSTVGSFASPGLRSKNDLKNPLRNSTAAAPSRLSKPAVSKPSVVTVGRGGAQKNGLQKETEKPGVGAKAHRPVLRGKAAKKESNEEVQHSEITNDDRSDVHFDSEVQLETPQKEESINQGETSPSENKHAPSTEEMSVPTESQKSIYETELVDDQESRNSLSQQPQFEHEGESLNHEENLSQHVHEEESHQEDGEVAPRPSTEPEKSNGAPLKSKDSTAAGRVKSPTLFSPASKITSSKGKTGAKTSGTSYRSNLSTKTGISSKRN